MSTKNAYEYMLSKHQEIIPDKWKTLLDTSRQADVSISWIGYMIATPTQFFTNFTVRKDHCVQYVIKGKGDYFTNNRLYSLQRGSLWLLPKDQYHYYTSNKDDPYEYYWIHLNGIGAEEFLNKIGLSERNPVIQNLCDPNIERQFNKLIEAAKSDSPDAHLVLSALHSLLYEIGHACSRTEVVGCNRNEKDIDDIISYIKDNYQKNVSLDDLAVVVNLDKAYMIRKFKLKTGLSPIQFLIQYRISKSCVLLNSDMPLKAIASVCGFNNLTNYFKRFKKFIGITPNQFRENLNKKHRQK
mgnify:CR=1 FL=1